MREISTDVEINAPASRVWEILTELAEYPKWNPFIRRAGGNVREGAKLEIRIEPGDGSTMTFKPTVLRADAGKEFRWLGRLILPGLFDGEHIFQLSAMGSDGTRLVHREEFRGILVPLLWGSLEAKTKKGFEAMNLALKQRAEDHPAS